MFEVLSDREQAAMRRAGRAAAATLAAVSAKVHAGVTTAAIDAWVRADTAARGGHPAPLGYHGFPAAVCTSVNEVVCHGIPRDDVILRDGDLVNVDVTTRLDGFHGDTSETLLVGGPAAASAEVRALVEATRACRAAGIAVVRAGVRLGDVGAAIAEVARAAGMGVVREYGGHGIGRAMHAPPHVSHVGVRGTGARLRAGMCITIEPMLTLGAPAIRLLDDGWTVVTADGRPSAQCEHTLLVTHEGCEVLTVLEPIAPVAPVG